MAHFLTARLALSELESMITTSRELTLLSPYVRPASDVTDWLRAADARGVAIRLVYGKEEMGEAQMRTFSQFRRLKLYYSERLHAKCYYNESRMIITSLNLLDSSEKNDEFGVRLDRDEQAYSDAAAAAERIIAAAAPRNSVGAKLSAALRTLVRSETTGFCIRCAQRIELDPDRPLCAACFASWARFENWEFAEKVCHRCGRPGATSRLKPQCYPCFKAAASRS